MGNLVLLVSEGGDSWGRLFWRAMHPPPLPCPLDEGKHGQATTSLALSLETLLANQWAIARFSCMILSKPHVSRVESGVSCTKINDVPTEFSFQEGSSVNAANVRPAFCISAV